MKKKIIPCPSYHDERREKDLQILCNKVLLVSAAESDYGTNCPFCYSNSWLVQADMQHIVHEHDCPYSIAKDLLTNL